MRPNVPGSSSSGWFRASYGFSSTLNLSSCVHYTHPRFRFRFHFGFQPIPYTRSDWPILSGTEGPQGLEVPPNCDPTLLNTKTTHAIKDFLPYTDHTVCPQVPPPPASSSTRWAGRFIGCLPFPCVPLDPTYPGFSKDVLCLAIWTRGGTSV